MLTSEVSWFAVSGDGARLVIGDDHKVRVVPSDRKVDNGSSDDAVTVDLSRARFSGRPGGAVGARVRGVRPAAAPGLLDPGPCPAWTGTGCSTSTGSCSTGSGPRPSSATCSGRSRPNSARRTPTSCRRARSPRATRSRGAPAALLGADVARSADGRWLVERVLPGESSDPHARSPFGAPGVAVREGDEILAVDGRPVDPVYGPWPALAGTHGKPVELTIRPADPSLVPWPPAAADDEDERGRRGDSAEAPTDQARDRQARRRPPSPPATPEPATPEPAAASATPTLSRPRRLRHLRSPPLPDSWATATADPGRHRSATASPEASETARVRRIRRTPRRARVPRDPPGRHRAALRRPAAPLPGLGRRPPPVRPRPVRRPGRLPARARHDGRGLGAPPP